MTYYSTSLVERDDILQEQALLELLGKGKTSRTLIFRRLSSQYRESSLELVTDESNEAAERSSSPLFAPTPLPPSWVLEELIGWAATQSGEAQAAIFAFLDNDLSLEEALEELGITLPSRPKGGTNSSVTQLIIRSLPATKPELYELVRTSHQTRRPEATVRTALRRLLAQGKIKLEGDTYHA